MRKLASIVVGLYATGAIFGVALGFVPIAAADDGEEDDEGNCTVNVGAQCGSNGECIVNGGVPGVAPGYCNATCLVNFAGDCTGTCPVNVWASCDLLDGL